MKKSTLLGFTLFSILIAAGTFWWGVQLGRADASRETTRDQQRRNSEAALIGNAGKASRNPDGNAQSSDGGNDRTVDEVMAEAMAVNLDGRLNPVGMAEAFSLFRELDERDLPVALKLVEGMKGVQTKRLLRMGLLSRWAEFDGSGPADYVLENPGTNPEGMTMDSQGRTDLTEIISTWCERDPEAAFKWLVNRSDKIEESGFDGRRDLYTIFRALSIEDADKAYAKLESLEDDQSRLTAMSGILIDADAQRRSELIGKLESFADPQTQYEGYQRLISDWARLKPEEAAAYIDNASELEANTVEMLANEVGRAWMQNNPEEGANWLIESATDENRSARINEIVRNWVGQDPNAAAEWLGEFEPSLEIDEALISLSGSIIQRDGEASFEWAARITDADKRSEVLSRTFYR